MHRSKSCPPRKTTAQQKHQNNNVSAQHSPTRTHAALFEFAENKINNPYTEYDFFENDLNGNCAPPNSPTTPRCKV